MAAVHAALLGVRLAALLLPLWNVSCSFPAHHAPCTRCPNTACLQEQHSVFSEPVCVRAFSIARFAHDGKYRASGEPAFMHCVEVRDAARADRRSERLCWLRGSVPILCCLAFLILFSMQLPAWCSTGALMWHVHGLN